MHSSVSTTAPLHFPVFLFVMTVLFSLTADPSTQIILLKTTNKKKKKKESIMRIIKPIKTANLELGCWKIVDFRFQITDLAVAIAEIWQQGYILVPHNKIR